jgi:hypothetical protein
MVTNNTGEGTIEDEDDESNEEKEEEETDDWFENCWFLVLSC